MWELFPGTPSQPSQSNKREQLAEFVTTHWLLNINSIPIDYAFRPRLRDRLTLRRLALRRNPWIRRQCLSHCFSLLVPAFALLIPPGALTGLPSQAYRTFRYRMHLRAHLKLRLVA